MNTFMNVRLLACLCAMTPLLFTACSTAPDSVQGKMDIEQEADAVLVKARRTDPSIARVFDRAAGNAVFPTVGKGAIGVGGAYGKGVLYEGGQVVGYCDLTQASIGFQLGGQAYSEIIAFETPEAIETFKEGRFRFGAQATAVAVKAGAGVNADFTDGVAVFTLDESGLMFEASVAGQKFAYQEK